MMASPIRLCLGKRREVAQGDANVVDKQVGSVHQSHTTAFSVNDPSLYPTKIVVTAFGPCTEEGDRYAASARNKEGGAFDVFSRFL